jgi:hypothetical protein
MPANPSALKRQKERERQEYQKEKAAKRAERRKKSAEGEAQTTDGADPQAPLQVTPDAAGAGASPGQETTLRAVAL